MTLTDTNKPRRRCAHTGSDQNKEDSSNGGDRGVYSTGVLYWCIIVVYSSGVF